MNSLQLRDFNFWYGQQTGLLHGQRAGNLVFHGELGGEVRKSREVEIEVAVVAVADGVGGPNAFRGGDGGTATTASSGGGGGAAIVVATLVSSQGLPRGEGLVADGTLVGLASAVGCCGAAGDGGGHGVVVLAAASELAVAGLVPAECLVRGEGFVAYRALVTEIRSSGGTCGSCGWICGGSGG